MSITLDEVVRLQHEQLRTLGQKLIWLSIKQRASATGWTKLGLSELRSLTGYSESGVIKTLKKMEECGLIEVKRDRSHPHNKNLYRVITP